MCNEMESGERAVKLVCPPAEKLSVIVNNITCEECGLSFRNEPRLRMHALKIHQRKNLEKTIKEDIHYHCPEIFCIYSPNSQRYFTRMKYLKQHYLKVHAAKKFACPVSRCEKSFSTEAAKLAHIKVCGIQFTCGICLGRFGTHEALLTHSKRTNHCIDEKYKNTPARMPSKLRRVVPTSVGRIYKPVSILPRYLAASNKIGIDIAVQTDNCKSKSSKEHESRQKQTNLTPDENGGRKTVWTQTIRKVDNSSDCQRKKRKKGQFEKDKDAFSKDNLGFNENLFPTSPLELEDDVGLEDCFWEEKNTSMGTRTRPERNLLEALDENVTQTELVSFYDDQEDQCNEAARLDLSLKNACIAAGDSRLTYNEEPSLNVETGCYTFGPRDIGENNNGVARSGNSNSSSNSSNSGITRADPMLTVQTFPDKFNSTETQTESAYSVIHTTLFDSDVGLGRNFTVSSNTETQTTEHFPNIEQLLYSNTCTQTCNDILPSDLGLSDIQTQTAWPELEDGALTTGVAPSTSTETQTRDSFCGTNPCTNMSSCRSWFLNNRTSHTETQTDLLSMFDEFQ